MYSLYGFLELTYNLAWIGSVWLIGLAIYTSVRSNGQYNAIPAIGGTGVFSSYLSAIRYLIDAKGMLQKGYERYKDGAFRVPDATRWHIVVSGKKLIEEIRKAPEDTLSFQEAAREGLATDYTIGPNISTDLYHIDIIRGQLTRNLAVLFPDVRDELVLAFEDILPTTPDWRKIRALETMMKIVARTSNRIFVGAPKCRDQDFIMLNIQFTTTVVIGGEIISLFPKSLRPLAGLVFSNVPKALRRGMKHLRPIIEERQRMIDEYGLDYPDKPNDMLSWLMDEAKGEERLPRNLTLRILHLNFAAIHTSSISVTQALFDLASRPEYIQPIREELESVIAKEGWSKVAMTGMRKLDSFLKESQRLNSLGAISMTRKALKDFTFSDGTLVPKGAFVSVASAARHRDNAVYTNSDSFYGYRFSDMRDTPGQGTKNQLVATSSDYLAFGYGKHACPGRFFAANELKAMVAHVILAYDFRMAKEGVRPENQWFGPACVPDGKAEMLFRKRQT